MKLFKPSWVNHDGNPIFSIDIHPDGTRFATGGQGPDKCGRIIIWNMAPVVNINDETSKGVPKVLCQMDSHLACINCVRWSNNGKYLGSAGDDRNLMIWQMTGKTNYYPQVNQQTVNVFEPSNIEQWKCLSTLNGHNGDILDLAWSSNDVYLASCSVDNMVIVWDARNFPQIVTKILGHSSFVKGVSWDPAGKYLASQSDDKTLRVWRTSDWKEEAVIKGPFKECSGTTHVLRLNWSPDGQILVSAHAMNNSGSVAQLIERDGWKTRRDLVGHRKAVTCVRFNPNILYQNKTKKPVNNEKNNSTSNGTSLIKSSNGNSKANSKAIRYSCFAVGSRDRSISVWLTSQPRPLIVTHDLFESSVLDFSWSSEGHKLLSCSQDGTVAVMLFSQAEIGQKLSQDEKQQFLQKLYGKSMTIAPAVTSKPLLLGLLVEEPELVAVEDNNAKKEKEVIDLVSDNEHSISQNGYGESNTSVSGMSKGPTDRQIETLLPGGRRRITPLYIQPTLTFDPRSKFTSSSSKETKTKIMIETTTSNPIPTPMMTPCTPVKHASTSLLSIRPTKYVKPLKPPPLRNLAPAKAFVFKVSDSLGRTLTLEAENDTAEKSHELRLLNESNERLWDISLTSKICSVIATQTFAVACSVDNLINVFDMKCGKELMPPIIIDSEVAHIAAQKSHFLAVTVCAHVWLWDMERMALLINSESISHLLISPTNNTTTSPQQQEKQSNQKSQKSSKTNEDNQPHTLNNNIEVLSCNLSEYLQPIILLSDGKAFLYNFHFGWSLISDTKDLNTRLSSCKPSLQATKRFLNSKYGINAADSQALKKYFPLTSLQTQVSTDTKLFSTASDVAQIKATRRFLDRQLVSTYFLRSPYEYHYWLLQSVQHFMDTGAEARLTELCTRLLTSSLIPEEDAADKMNSSDNSSNSNKANDRREDACQILGLKKKDLLKEILSKISTDLRYQRIYSEFKQQLDYNPS